METLGWLIAVAILVAYLVAYVWLHVFLVRFQKTDRKTATVLWFVVIPITLLAVPFFMYNVVRLLITDD